MTPNLFRYPDEQWRRMEEIVQCAGGDVARDKFNAQRAPFVKMVDGWQRRLARWDGFTWSGHDDDETYKSIESAAGELRAALVKLGFPALFIGNGLVWEHGAETQENMQRYDAFLRALRHVRTKAAMMTERGRKRPLYARDRFIADLARVWRDLELRITMGDTSPFVAFAVSASEGVVNFRNEEAARTAILHTIWKWAGSPVDRANRRDARAKLRAGRGAKIEVKEF